MPKLWTLVAMNLVASLQGTVDHHKARNNKLGVEILRWISLPTFFGLSSYTIYKFLILRYNDEGRKNTSDEFLCIIELWKSESLARGIKCWQIQLPVHFYSGFPPPPIWNWYQILLKTQHPWRIIGSSGCWKRHYSQHLVLVSQHKPLLLKYPLSTVVFSSCEKMAGQNIDLEQ